MACLLPLVRGGDRALLVCPLPAGHAWTRPAKLLLTKPANHARAMTGSGPGTARRGVPMSEATGRWGMRHR